MWRNFELFKKQNENKFSHPSPTPLPEMILMKFRSHVCMCQWQMRMANSMFLFSSYFRLCNVLSLCKMSGKRPTGHHLKVLVFFSCVPTVFSDGQRSVFLLQLWAENLYVVLHLNLGVQQVSPWKNSVCDMGFRNTDILSRSYPFYDGGAYCIC
jgi:hypothetical protein